MMLYHGACHDNIESVVAVGLGGRRRRDTYFIMADP